MPQWHFIFNNLENGMFQHKTDTSIYNNRVNIFTRNEENYCVIIHCQKINSSFFLFILFAHLNVNNSSYYSWIIKMSEALWERVTSWLHVGYGVSSWFQAQTTPGMSWCRDWFTVLEQWQVHPLKQLEHHDFQIIWDCISVNWPKSTQERDMASLKYNYKTSWQCAHGTNISLTP